jgi:hypothetical protein
MAISNQSNSYDLFNSRFASVLQWPSDSQQCSLAITRRILDGFVNQETGKCRRDFSLFVERLVMHSNGTACGFASSRNWLETALHGSEAHATW